MYTFLLWRALQSPPAKNPLFLQMQMTAKFSWLDRFWNGLIGLLALFFFWKPPLFVIAVISIPVMYPILSSTCYGVMFSLRTASMIFARRQQGSYDLIRISPAGAWTSFWAICAGSVHRNNDLTRLNHYLKRLVTMLLSLSGILLFASLFLPTDRLKSDFLIMVIVLWTVVGLMILELTQSTILSTLIGMLFAILGRTQVDSRIGALVGFLSIQITTYLTSAVLAFSVLYPRLLNADLSPILATSLGCVTCLLYVAILREWIAFLMWRLIARQLNTNRDELRQMIYRPEWIKL